MPLRQYKVTWSEKVEHTKVVYARDEEDAGDKIEDLLALDVLEPDTSEVLEFELQAIEPVYLSGYL